MSYLIDFVKGIIIGFFMLVPGISGGSIAIILGIYDKLLISLNDIFKRFKTNFIFLFIVGLGGLVGIFLSSFILDFFIKNYYFELLYIFVGMMGLHSFNVVKNIKKTQIVKSIFFILVGLFIGFLITNIPPSFFSIGNKFFTLLFLGVFLAIALILPGVSVSYVLLIFNMYDDIILAIKNLDIIYLLEIGMFLVIGLLLVIKLLHYLILKKKEMISNLIIGFIITSIWIVLPKFSSFNEIVYFLIFVIIGILIKKVIPDDN